jgi:GntR family transcriptional repressor for pyruvate dehydrogenase complex
LKVLEIMGIDAARGRRRLVDDLTHHELFETRLIVEPELAKRAAERATAGDLAALRKAISDMETGPTLKDRLDADLAFHEYIFQAAGNRICHLLFRTIHRTLLSSMDQLHGLVDIQQPVAAHKAIYKAIAARNPDLAMRRMQAHLVGARDLFTARKDSRAPIAQPKEDAASRAAATSPNAAR